MGKYGKSDRQKRRLVLGNRRGYRKKVSVKNIWMMDAAFARIWERHATVWSIQWAVSQFLVAILLIYTSIHKCSWDKTTVETEFIQSKRLRKKTDCDGQGFFGLHTI